MNWFYKEKFCLFLCELNIFNLSKLIKHNLNKILIVFILNVYTKSFIRRISALKFLSLFSYQQYLVYNYN